MIKSYYFTRIFSVLFLFFTTIIVFGCAVSGSGKTFVFETVEDKATIYHYRPSSFRGSALQWDVISNEKPLTRIGNGGYFKQVSEPGQIIYRTKDNRSSVIGVVNIMISNSKAEYQEAYILNVEAGENYFLNWRVQLTEDVPLIREVPYDEAIDQINGLLAFPPAVFVEKN